MSGNKGMNYSELFAFVKGKFREYKDSRGIRDLIHGI